MRKGFQTLAVVGMGIVILKAVVMLAYAVLWSWRQEYAGDAMLFLAVGRAILNGLAPYADIWENKPPGIFLLAAAGLKFGHNLALVRIVEAACIVLPATPITGAVAWLTRKDRTPRRMVTIAMAFLFGTLLSYHSLTYDDGMMTEVFGAMFGVGYVVLLAAAPARLSPRWIVPLGVSLWAAAFFKEPFALTLFACILVLRPRTIRTLEETVWQCCVALTVHVVVLTLAGMASEYFTIYLPYIIFDHRAFVPVFSNLPSTTPAWMLGLNIGTLLTYLWNAHPLLAVSMAMCWIFAILLPLAAAKRWSRPALRQAGVILLTTYIALFAVSFSGDWGHRTLVAIPWLVALFFLNVRTFREQPHVRIVEIARTGFACVMTLAVIALPVRWQLHMPHPDEPEAPSFARNLDAMLDTCGIDRYLELSHLPQQIHGLTRHSPLPSGPFSVRLEQRLSVQLFRDMIDQSLEKADVVLLRNPELLNSTTYGPDLVKLLEKVHTRFKVERWPCAEEFTFPDNVFVLFRQR